MGRCWVYNTFILPVLWCSTHSHVHARARGACCRVQHHHDHRALSLVINFFENLPAARERRRLRRRRRRVPPHYCNSCMSRVVFFYTRWPATVNNATTAAVRARVWFSAFIHSVVVVCYTPWRLILRRLRTCEESVCA